MTVSLDIDITDLNKEIDKHIKKIAKIEVALKRVAVQIENMIKESFSKKRTPEGKAWAPWSATTIKKSGTKGSLLVRSGALRSGIKVIVRQGELLITTDVKYANVQQFGNKFNKAWGRGKAPIPARKFIPIKNFNELDPVAKKMVINILNDYFKG